MLSVGNTGRTIPPGENIFERFHHRSTPSAASGHGIGLNLARELARLHGAIYAWFARKTIGLNLKCAFLLRTVLMLLHEAARPQPVRFCLHSLRL